MNPEDKSIEETQRIKMFFQDFLEKKGYSDHDGLMSKGFVVFKFIFSGKMISARDLNPDHKFDHIILCRTPKDLNQSEVMYELLELERKEVGSKAWKVLQERIQSVK